MIPWMLFVSVGLLIFIGFKLVTDSKNWLEYIKFFPLIIFLWCAKLLGMNEEAWRTAFIASGLAACLLTGFLIYKKVVLDRLMLGANIFLIVGALAFIFDIESILYWYGVYQGAVFILPIVVVGICSLCSSAGFIGIENKNKEAVRSTSLYLLGASVICLLWSIMLNRSGIFISAALPFIVLKIIQAKLIEWKFHKNTI